MKTTELTGALLDYWVARAEGMNHPPKLAQMRPGCCLVPVTNFEDGGTMTRWLDYQPSIDWAQGGPIIERERICITSLYDARNRFVYWGADMGAKQETADTALMAAMRAYVASKFGGIIPDQFAA